MSSQQLTLGRRTGQTIQFSITYVLLIAGALIIAVPFFWMISTSLKQQMDVYIFPPQWIPSPLVWKNYQTVVTIWPFFLYAGNSAFIAISCIIGMLVSSSLAAYGFARLRAPGRDVLFLIMLATLMLPGQVTLIPIYVLFSKLGWIDSFKPLIVPAFFGGPFNIFLLRQFFLSLPFELEDAARVDGCSSLQTFYRIMLPLAMPALAVVAIFEFVFEWNDFFQPLIYINSPNKQTLALALQLFQGSDATEPQLNLLMAASFLCILPILLLFTIAQKYFIQGIVFTGVKG